MRRMGIGTKLFSLGITAALVCSMAFPMGTAAEGAESTASKEQGVDETEAVAPVEVIEISTAEELLAFADQCHIDSWSAGKWVVLKQDIDLTGMDFEMIPIFCGTFDGQGHTVSGFRNVGDGYVEGFFRYVGVQGEVKNLKLSGSVQGAETDECMGGICGVNYGTIRDCSFDGTIKGVRTVGGIAGTNEGTGVIKNCTMRGHVLGYNMTGGIVGFNHGTIIGCKNDSNINDDSEWVETDDERGPELFQSMNGSGSEVDLFSGVDTGGIAGYSDGVIASCTNDGRIGYEHTGYNIGGIAGRHAGTVMLCTNWGDIFGRKDVGGIVGQMEPYIEVDEAESLRNAVNKLHNLINRTLDHLQEGKDVVKGDVDRLTAHGDAARDSGHALADQLTDFVDANTEQVRAMGARMEYVTEQLPAVLDNMTAAQTAFGRFCDSVKLSVKDPGSVSDGNGSAGGQEDPEQTESALKELQTVSDRVKESADRINGIIKKEDGTVKEWNSLTTEQREQVLTELADLAGNAAEWSSAVSKVLTEAGGAALTEESAEALRSMSESLKNAGNRAKDIAVYINAQPKLHFTALGEQFDQQRENLNLELKGVSESLKSLTAHASDYSDLVNEDLKAVNDQLNVVFQLLADHLSGYSGLSVEEAYEEISYEEMYDITAGRTDSCTNRGTVRGDINVGGISGSMSIDQEDPEDNAAGSIDYEIGRRFVMKCVIGHCENQGRVIAKKDGAGGIVGYMEHGIAADSSGYGSVESTEGNYVGGVCGQSLTVLKNCYALCDVSGNRYVGGIAGYACTLKDCCAIVNVEASSGRKGSIAGWAAVPVETEDAEDPMISQNYYVGGEPYGIDGISYAGIAEPLEYEELLEIEGVPERFRHLQVAFWIGDTCLGVQEVAYGKSLSVLQYPEIPEQEGCYGAWPDYSDRVMKGDLVIRGEYKDNVLVVESGEKQEEDDGAYEKPYALVERKFTEDTVLRAGPGNAQPPEEIGDREYVVYDVVLENGGVGASDVFAVRLLNPYDEAEVWGRTDGEWVRLACKERGTYLQVDMTGPTETFCIARKENSAWIVWTGAGAAVCVAAAAAVWIRHRKKKKKKKGEPEKSSD